MFREIEVELTSIVRISTMANLSTEFHEHLTRPGVKNDQEISICLLEGDLIHVNVVSFDEYVSYSTTLMNLYERNEYSMISLARVSPETQEPLAFTTLCSPAILPP